MIERYYKPTLDDNSNYCAQASFVRCPIGPRLAPESGRLGCALPDLSNLRQPSTLHARPSTGIVGLASARHDSRCRSDRVGEAAGKASGHHCRVGLGVRRSVGESATKVCDKRNI